MNYFEFRKFEWLVELGKFLKHVNARRVQLMNSNLPTAIEMSLTSLANEFQLANIPRNPINYL